MKWIFVALMFLAQPFVCAQQLNQASYHPGSVKRVFLDKAYQKAPYTVLDQENKVVLEGSFSWAGDWSYSGTSVCYADFSDIEQPGTYTLLVAETTLSVPFRIEADSYTNLAAALIKSYYHARASIEILPDYAGKFARKMGHPDDRILIHASAASPDRPAGSSISSPGGWYDAGDYNKYIVNSGITTFTLLHALELFPEYFDRLPLNIPESGNRLPDLLDETLYNLRWMMTMQDPGDGGVYHKLTSLGFCGMVMPENDLSDRYVVMKSTAAGLDFAATLAKAARVLRAYEPALPGLADSCLSMAEKAWGWCILHPDLVYKQPADVSTGEYGDRNLSDEWFWAACELYLSTGKKAYLKKASFSPVDFRVPEWRRTGLLGVYSLLSSPKKLSASLLKESRETLMELAGKYLETYRNSPYKISNEEFPWGSNGEVANQGVLFIHAYRLSSDRRYLDAADACLGYLLGANPVGTSFITGFGIKSPMHIHERRSVADGIPEPVPGLLAGGPTLQARNDCGPEAYPSEYPAACYLDDVCSYSTNEIAINWNAPAVLLVSALDQLLNK
ncbi:MAG: glycoside hydrolase family 9 protein [Bacteroidota bacterium]